MSAWNLFVFSVDTLLERNGFWVGVYVVGGLLLAARVAQVIL
jgi:hypothetical protein